jgi:hypothetical protein
LEDVCGVACLQSGQGSGGRTVLVLELGSVPLPVVTARIDRSIGENGKGPYADME